MITTKKSYKLIHPSSLVITYFINYIIRVNEEVGVHVYKNPFGLYLVVSNTELPSSSRLIISYHETTERAHPDFEILDIAPRLLALGFFTFGIKDTEFQK